MNRSNVRRMIKDESRWLFIENKFILVILIFMFTVIFLFLHLLVNGHEIFLDEKERFIKIQLFKVKYYAERGAHLYDGYNVMHVPSQLSFLISENPPYVYSTVSKKAPVFRGYGAINVFLPITNGFLTWQSCIFFGFIMILLGAIGQGDKSELKHLYPYGTGNAITKMIIIDICVLVLGTFFCFISKPGRLIFSSPGIWPLLTFAVYSVLLGNYFFALGNLFRVLFIDKIDYGVFSAFFLWLFSTMILPGLIFQIYDTAMILKDKEDNTRKIQWRKEMYGLTTMLTAENFDNKTRKQNRSIEEFEMKKSLKKIEWESEVIERTVKSEFEIGKYAAFCPNLYYNYLSHEIGGFSNRAYMDLFKHSLKLKKRLFEFFLSKKVYKLISIGKSEETLEEYIKPGMLTYNGKNYIPPSFCRACGIILIYTLILFLVSHWFELKRRKKRKRKRRGQVIISFLKEKYKTCRCLMSRWAASNIHSCPF